jgi:hypothetical protein
VHTPSSRPAAALLEVEKGPLHGGKWWSTAYVPGPQQRKRACLFLKKGIASKQVAAELQVRHSKVLSVKKKLKGRAKNSACPLHRDRLLVEWNVSGFECSSA